MVKLGKYNLNKHTMSSIYHRHVRPIFDERLRGNSAWQRRFLFLTNNYCNLSCFSCSALSDREWGSNPFRDKPYTEPLENLEKFLTLIEGFRPDYWIRVSGGESTLCGPEYLEELCEIVHSHNRKVSLLTNGARADEIDPEWFEFIHLDEHIVNQENVYRIKDKWQRQGYKRFQVLTTKVHRDLGLQRKDHVTKGTGCEAWLEVWSVWRGLVYPCCVLPFLDGWNNDNIIKESLRETGFTVDNPNLVDQMINWKEHVPWAVKTACKRQCWKDGPNIEYHKVS